MKIEYLADHPEHAELVARWNYMEWAYLYEKSSYAGFLRGTKSNMNKDQVPFTLVALESGRAIGSVSLLKEENEDRKDLSPWLSSMYVDPGCRGMGVGRALNESVLSFAFDLGLSDVFLEALDQNIPFYRKLGWREIDSCEYKNQSVTIMHMRTRPNKALQSTRTSRAD